MVALDSSPAKNHSGAENMLGIKKSKKKKSKKIDTESVQVEVNQIDAAKINAMKEMVNQDDSPKKKKKKKKDKRKEDGEKVKIVIKLEFVVMTFSCHLNLIGHLILITHQIYA